MNVSTIGNEITKTRPMILRRTANRLVTAVLGAGLLLSTNALKAHELKKDVLQKETPEMTVSSTEAEEAASDKSLVGGFLFGGMILAYMGAVWAGNRIHDKKPEEPKQNA